MKLLEVKNLKKIYHTLKQETIALEDISFSINEGEFISIVGPSGCGKSTILSILNNLIDKSDGQINIKNNIKIAYMLQEDCLLPFRTVLENCLIGLEITNSLNDDSKNYVIYLLKTYGLGDYINHYPSSLSGGMRQRVALIRTLAVKPDVLLLDEALSALDYQSRIAIADDIYNVIKKEGKTAIMVTHDIGEAISMSDKVIVLTKRPATIKNIYKINFKDNSNPIITRTLPEYNNYFDLIWRDLDVHI